MHAALLLATIAAMAAVPAPAPATLAGLAGSQYSRRLQTVVDHSVHAAIARFAADSLDTAQVAVTLVDLSAARPEWASVRGGVPLYPASVVKLFYLVAAHRWMEDGRLNDTEELRRAMRDMIVDSSNDATSYVVDVLTGTTSGPELPVDSLASWHDRRGAVNRYFAALGYRGINCDKKPWGDGPYGRETQASKAFEPARNQLTTDAVARLLAEIATGGAVTADRSRQMLELLARDYTAPSTDPDDQARAFTGQVLAPPIRLWSKAGWTSRVRHDAALLQLADGRRFVLVTFTEGHADRRDVIATIAQDVLQSLETK